MLLNLSGWEYEKILNTLAKYEDFVGIFSKSGKICALRDIQVGRALHRYRRSHGFESRPNKSQGPESNVVIGLFFRFSFRLRQFKFH